MAAMAAFARSAISSGGTSFDVRCDRPKVAERILHGAEAVAPELIRDLHRHRRAGDMPAPPVATPPFTKFEHRRTQEMPVQRGLKGTLGDKVIAAKGR
jgi:hypothetical protein